MTTSLIDSLCLMFFGWAVLMLLAMIWWQLVTLSNKKGNSS